MSRIPFGFRAEYRGVAEGREYTHRGTGEVRTAQTRYKFEVELPDGDVEIVSVGGQSFDQVAGFDVKALKKGDLIWMEGVISDGVGDDGRPYVSLRPLHIERVQAGQVKAA